MFSTTCVTTASLSEPTSVCDRHTMPARSPPAGGIPSRAFGLPGIMFATLGVNPADHLGPNPYHPFPKVTNIPLDQISTPLLWNIWFIASSICSSEKAMAPHSTTLAWQIPWMEECCLQGVRVLIVVVSNWLKSKFVKRQQTRCSIKVEWRFDPGVCL